MRDHGNKGQEEIMEDLISVIMSTYNESLDEIKKSVESVLGQTYKRIEYIVVLDNPQNTEIKSYFKTLSDSRIKLIENKTNVGLVRSLNKALQIANGTYIARMDADDISASDRLTNQVSYLKENHLDMVGGSIDIIDETGQIIGRQRFPQSSRQINFFLRWGTCIPHPTWLVDKQVYLKLDGYRNIPDCEDYDFICRAIQGGFKLGNVDKTILQYRIRKNSISNRNRARQYLIRNYISKHRKKYLSEKEIQSYINSVAFKKELLQYKKFQEMKKKLKEKGTIVNAIELLENEYTYKLFLEKIGLKIRDNM